MKLKILFGEGLENNNNNNNNNILAQELKKNIENLKYF